jgi:hypothetical protein
MSFGGRLESGDAPAKRSRWLARLLGAGLAGLFLLPVGAWAAGPDTSPSVGTASVAIASATAGTLNGGARLTLIGTTAISDEELATEVAKGIVKPNSSAGQSIQGPQVTLWDDVERPGTLISSGSLDTTGVYTSSVWH